MRPLLDRIIDESLQQRRTAIDDVIRGNPLSDLEVDEIDGRMVRVGEHWIADFASCNYLGLDLDPEVIEEIGPALRAWGVHPSWTRLVASPSLYRQAEALLAELIGVPGTLILPTLTLVHIGVLPALLGKKGIALFDRSAHTSMYNAALLARGQGAEIQLFDSGDMDQLAALLAAQPRDRNKVIVVDGVYSMSAEYARVPPLIDLAQRHDALIYVDDAHGFGVIGEAPSVEMPYGHRGNGVVRFHDCAYDNIVYAAGCSKAYSSLAAFVACSETFRQFIKAYASPFIFSGPCPTASLQSLLTGLAINARRGDALRRRLHQLTRRCIEGLRGLGFHVPGSNEFPIVSVWIGEQGRLDLASEVLWRAGVLPTVAAYPLVRRGEECIRLSLTAANTDSEIEMLLRGFGQLRDALDALRAPLQPAEVNRAD